MSATLIASPFNDVGSFDIHHGQEPHNVLLLAGVVAKTLPIKTNRLVVQVIRFVKKLG